jgi:hypothetical protein
MWSILLSGPSRAVAAAGVVAAGAAAGLLAAVVMDLPMSRQSDGFTPAFVAASVIQRTSVDAVSFRAAAVVHHGAGALAGVLWALVALATALPLGVDLAAAPLRAVAVPHVIGVVATTGFIYAFFAHVVLPRAGRGIYEERATAVRGQWLRSSLVFGAAHLLIAPALLTLL